jgi:hypothetical protein
MTTLLRSHVLAWARLVSVILAIAAPAWAQGTAADYARANGLRAKYEALVVNVPGPATWIDKTSHFWYRRTGKDGSEFVIVDADTRQKRPAFDHQKLATSLSAATGKTYTARTLPFNTIGFADNEQTLEVAFDGASWRCGLAEYDCRKVEGQRGPGGGRGAGPGRPEDTRPRVSPDRKRKRSSTTSTSQSAKPGRRRSRLSASTDPRGTPTSSRRSHGPPTRRRLRRIA